MEEITYTTSIDNIQPQDLEGFFVGWNNKPTPEKHLTLLKNSDFIVVAKSGGKVVGFITAISDHILSAYIPLLEVLPEYQDHGIGKKLSEIMLENLKDLYMIDLQCDESLQDFYETFGMKKSSGMSIRNYHHQNPV